MKKFIVIALLVFLVIPISATPLSKTFTVFLDLTQSLFSIEKIGFSTSIPNLGDSGNLPASSDSLNLVINKEDGLVEGSKFYIWWYLYSDSEYRIECKVTPFMGIEDVTNTIDFVTTARSNTGNTESLTSINNKVVNVLGDYNPNQGLYSGYVEYTINPFSYVDLTADNYMAMITINLVSAT